MKPINLKRLITAIIIPELVGVAAAILSGNIGESYKAFKQPPLSPPAFLFPIVWAILYALMGISAARQALKCRILLIDVKYSTIILAGQYWFRARMGRRQTNQKGGRHNAPASEFLPL